MRHAILLVLVLGLGSTARAQAPDRVFAGTIVISAKAFAPPAKTDAETITAIRKQAAVTFAEDKKDHTWTLFLVGYFKQPVDDMEYILKVRDLSNQSQVILTADKFLSARGARSASTKLVLDKDKVGVTKELLVTMEIKNKPIATARVQITGEGEHHTGTVDFSDDDADDAAEQPEPNKK
jgi:hypothetical protein